MPKVEKPKKHQQRTSNVLPATSNLQKLCDSGAAKGKRNLSQGSGKGLEIYIAWIYQSRYIKKEDGIQKTVEKEKKKQSRKHEGTKARKKRV